MYTQKGTTQFLAEDTFRHPVAARFNGHDWESHGLAHEDYARMSTTQQVLAHGRRGDCPVWVVNTPLTAQVVARFMERRAKLRKQLPGTIKERIERAERLIKENVPGQRARLIEFLVRHKQAYGEEREKLAVVIENIDTQIVIAEMGARLVTGVISYYHLQGWNSVDTARALGLKPPHVRQIVYRLARCWREICGERLPNRRPKNVEKPCVRCGEQFKPSRGDRQKFCSTECNKAAHAKTTAPFECAYCFKIVVPVAGQPRRRKYCSQRCGALAYEASHVRR